MTKRKPRSSIIDLFLLLGGGLCLILGVSWAVYTQSFSVPIYSLLTLSLVLFLAIFVRFERANLAYYLHVGFYSVLVGGICVVLYLFAMQYTQTLDLTKQKIHSLSEASQTMLKNLDREVDITIFIPDSGREQFQPLENLYNRYTDKLKWNFVDATRDPLAAQKFGESVHNLDMFFKSGDNTKKLSAAELDPQFITKPVMAEQTFTNAIVSVSRKTKPKIYFLSGHGEVNYNSVAASGQGEVPPPSLSGLRKALEGRGIETAELDLVKTGKIPDDATAVVEAGPQRDLFDPELAALQNYLKGGGHLLVMIDPRLPTQLGTVPTPLTNLRSLLNAYGVRAPNDLIFDATSQVLQIKSPIFPQIAALDPRHEITAKLAGQLGGQVISQNNFVRSPTRPLEKGDVPGDMDYTELVKSSPLSWPQDLQDLAKATVPPQNQMKAQVYGVAIGKKAPPAIPGMDVPKEARNNTRLVVYGTSALIQDRMLSGNDIAIMLMFNTMDWLTDSGQMYTIPPRQPTETPIILTEAQQRILLMFSVILIPCLLFFGGVSYSVIRRRR